MENLAVSNTISQSGGSKVRRAMLDVIIALVPAVIAAIVFFKLDALIPIAVCVGTAVLSEAVFNLICKRKQTVSDLSAVVTGLLLALSLPVSVTIWQCVVGSLFAIVIVKCAFGGIGYNFANPSVASRVMLIVAFGTVAQGADGELPSYVEMLVSNRGGMIGEACAAALLVGGIYLVIRRVVSWYAPVAYIAGVFALSFALTQDVKLALYYVFSGGLIIGAIFMATDPVTSPKKCLGKIVFVLCCAVITVLIRVYGTNSEGATFFAILMMNILCPYIDRISEKKQVNEEVAK